MGFRGVIRVATRGVAVDPGGVRESTMEAAVPRRTPRKPLLCRLNMRHRWVPSVNGDGGDYRHCTDEEAGRPFLRRSRSPRHRVRGGFDAVNNAAEAGVSMPRGWWSGWS